MTFRYLRKIHSWPIRCRPHFHFYFKLAPKYSSNDIKYKSTANNNLLWYIPFNFFCYLKQYVCPCKYFLKMCLVSYFSCRALHNCQRPLSGTLQVFQKTYLVHALPNKTHTRYSFWLKAYVTEISPWSIQI